MTDIAQKHISEAAYIVAEEIRRRMQFGHPIPPALLHTLAALNRALSAGGSPAPPDLPAWKSTKQLATEWGCTPRTVRNRAADAGGQLVGGRWIFPEDT